MRSSMHAVNEECNNYIIDPALCDKKSCSEHQTLFPLFGGGVWARDYNWPSHPILYTPIIVGSCPQLRFGWHT